MDNVLYHCGPGFEVESFTNIHVAQAIRQISIGHKKVLAINTEIYYHNDGTSRVIVTLYIEGKVIDLWVKDSDSWIPGKEAKLFARECFDKFKSEIAALTLND